MGELCGLEAALVLFQAPRRCVPSHAFWSLSAVLVVTETTGRAQHSVLVMSNFTEGFFTSPCCGS